jgi:hypothetical protein
LINLELGIPKCRFETYVPPRITRDNIPRR